MSKTICYELLTKGIYNFNENEQKPDVKEINKYFRDLNCIVKYWYDKTSLILVNKNDEQIGKTENERKDVEFYKKLINNENITSYDRKKLHIQNGWIYEENNRLCLTKKFMVQYEDFMLENNEDWKVCNICNILVYKTNEHEYCVKKKQELLQKVRMME